MAEGAKLILVTGGARSGKSRFAEDYCKKLQQEKHLPVTYLATCPRIDKELEARIAAHVARRPVDWKCIEETTNVAKRILELDLSAGILLVDCLSLLLNNWMWEKEIESPKQTLSEQETVELTLDLLDACTSYTYPILMVTNEVGSGIVPESKSIRQYRDCLGLMNQTVAKQADEVYGVFSGIPVNLKEIQTKL